MKDTIKACKKTYENTVNLLYIEGDPEVTNLDTEIREIFF